MQSFMSFRNRLREMEEIVNPFREASNLPVFRNFQTLSRALAPLFTLSEGAKKSRPALESLRDAMNGSEREKD